MRVKSLATLKRLATLATRYRGHSMGWIGPIGTCKACAAWVHLDPAPPPNGIDMGGSAVAINCIQKPNEKNRSDLQ